MKKYCKNQRREVITRLIPFNEPFLDEREATAVAKAVRGSTLHGDGPISRRVQNYMKNWIGAKYVYLTTSCTHALEMAMMSLGIGSGDEVIMPSFTFPSTANAVVLRGAKPVFADIHADTLNIDSEDIKRRITSHTKAIIPIHYAGVACDMDALMEISYARGIAVVEDAAQGVDAKYKKHYLGTIGDIGCYSFHDTKNIVCGEGGAFITNDEKIARKAELVREKGTNRSAYFRGEVDKYTWVNEGSSYILSDMLAAVLEVQMQKKEEIKLKRKSIWETYYRTLKPLAEEGRLLLPSIPKYCESNYQIFFFRVSDETTRNKLLLQLKEIGVEATFHYMPLHNSPFGRKIQKSTECLPVTEECSATLIRLPLYPQLEEKINDISGKISDLFYRVLKQKKNGKG
jgi:dTDP-4-amino-4,6-dideoxygalactose transaminase